MVKFLIDITTVLCTIRKYNPQIPYFKESFVMGQIHSYRTNTRTHKHAKICITYNRHIYMVHYLFSLENVLLII